MNWASVAGHVSPWRPKHPNRNEKTKFVLHHLFYAECREVRETVIRQFHTYGNFVRTV